MDEYHASKADKCYICSGPILDRLYTVDEGKIHAEGDCMDKYREQKADKCFMCKKPILGSFYTVDDGKICAEGDCKEVRRRCVELGTDTPSHDHGLFCVERCQSRMIVSASPTFPACLFPTLVVVISDHHSNTIFRRPTSAWCVASQSWAATTLSTTARSAPRATACRSTADLPHDDSEVYT